MQEQGDKRRRFHARGGGSAVQPAFSVGDGVVLHVHKAVFLAGIAPVDLEGPFIGAVDQHLLEGNQSLGMILEGHGVIAGADGVIVFHPPVLGIDGVEAVGMIPGIEVLEVEIVQIRPQRPPGAPQFHILDKEGIIGGGHHPFQGQAVFHGAVSFVAPEKDVG